MSAEIRLSIAVLAQTGQAADIAGRIAAEVAQPFFLGSERDIVLKPAVSALDFGPRYAGRINADAMHNTLARLLGGAARAARVDHIGLLVADEYRDRGDYFGLMFDADFSPDSSDQNAWIARQGCAIFLGAMGERRDGQALADEAVYTAIHELGHVFNQQHSAPPSFMSTSADQATPFVLADCSFSEQERYLLSHCSRSECIWPGGSRFGDLGTLGKSVAAPQPQNADGAVRLQIAMERHEFWPFEPMELDIELSLVLQGRAAAVQVPDALDPGFDNFTVWIEEPGGERRRYRAPKHFCAPGAARLLAHGQPLRRDLSIFGESGRFTFRHVGRHTVQAAFTLPSGQTLRSNRLEVEVLAPAPGTAVYDVARAVLCDVDLCRLLYYRALTPARQRKLNRLKDACKAAPWHPLVGTIHYAIGRAFAAETRQAAAENAPTATLARSARLHLRQAAAHQHLGDHRRQHAERELAAIPE
ncbi:hypothetical protein [Janthinobacterium fluminis]|uniref:Uncharacterized protein n=1 Tax=Janthinobacterium fluminis TaxID=2987524 RepID=A0ABT5JWN9_9BURK|nr:hypothetical protein [Janthinobacterium fluminis]MDC8757054.1 hypothetical protein [Janthinobacterium fluminis]